jgi:hypothetical protein
MSIAGELVTAGDAIMAAITAMGSAVYTSRKSATTSWEVEVLKANLTREWAAEQAQRSFEYEARKRVYTDANRSFSNSPRAVTTRQGESSTSPTPGAGRNYGTHATPAPTGR